MDHDENVPQREGMEVDAGDNVVVEGEDDPSRLVRREVVEGQQLGNQRVRIIYPTRSSLKRRGSGVLQATAQTEIPSGGWGRFTYNVKRLLIGAPLATAQAEYERLTRFKALAVLSSDAISSVAYATEAILYVLLIEVGVGSANLWPTLFISLAIVGLLSIVALSYRQTIPAYPNGGGSYIVAKDNLGALPGLIAAASLLIDYVLTVSVSIASGVQNLASLFTSLSPYVVEIDVALVFIVTVVNLRGVRESGTIFSLPTYLFIFSAYLLIVVGSIKSFFIAHHPIVNTFSPYVAPTEALTAFVFLRAFASGCSAMTGVEAISNGIPAFKKPETHNAAITLTWMAVILGTLFLGIAILATSYGIEPKASGIPSVISQIASQVFTGPLFFMFPVFQISTLLILTLAANTSYADFPRLSSILARDNYMPHQFAFRGDRLAFSTGIVFLAVLAASLLIVFKGDTSLLINLYAVGVFMSFTLSQGGMVRHWWRLRTQDSAWLRKMLINGLGATTTLVVALIISIFKFSSGAWIVVILIPVLVVTFELIHRHYTRVERERTTDIPIHIKDIRHRLIVPISHFDRVAVRAVLYARSISANVAAVHIAYNKRRAEEVRAGWDRWQERLPEEQRTKLEILEPRHHSLTRNLLEYIDRVFDQSGGETLTVVLPEDNSASWLEYIFRNREALRIKAALLFKPNVITTDVTPDPTNRFTLQNAPSDSESVNGNAPVEPERIQHRFIVPIAGMDRVSKQSLAYARSISPNVTAVHVSIDPADVEKLRLDWQNWQRALAEDERSELVVIESPYRSLSRPLLNYIDTVHELYADHALTVILPEFIVAHWWEHPLHNQTALQLKAALLFRPGLIVTSVPQHLPSRPREQGLPALPTQPMRTM